MPISLAAALCLLIIRNDRAHALQRVRIELFFPFGIKGKGEQLRALCLLGFGYLRLFSQLPGIVGRSLQIGRDRIPIDAFKEGFEALVFCGLMSSNTMDSLFSYSASSV